MKKIFYAIAISCLAFASCSKNEADPINSKTTLDDMVVINYLPVEHLTNSTKALVTGTTFETNLTFGSLAYFYEDANVTSPTIYIPKQEISYDGSQWTTANAYYWPKSDDAYLAFYSFYPYAVAGYMQYSESAKNGLIVNTYDVDANQAHDVMIATAVPKATKKLYAENGVSTVFNHILSVIKKITIKTKEDYSATQTFALKSVTLNGVDYEGTFDGTAWTATADKAKDVTLFDGDLAFTKDETNVKITDNEYYIVLPQNITAAKTLTIVYTITTGESVETVTNALDITTLETFGINKAYQFDLTIQEDKITWNPSVVDWDKIETTSITVE